MSSKEKLKGLVETLDEETARRILRDWERIVSSHRDVAVIHFDGSARPNPGEMGIGAVVECCGKKVEISKKMGFGTNNIAEYLALIEALKVAKKMGARGVEIYGDSSIVIEQLRGRWKSRNEKLRELKREALEILSGFEWWKAEWIPESENERAHELANREV